MNDGRVPTRYNSIDGFDSRVREVTMALEGAVINGQMVLNQSLALPEGAKVKVEIRQRREPQNEWQRRLRQAASDCGVSLSNEAVSSEGIYE